MKIGPVVLSTIVALFFLIAGCDKENDEDQPQPYFKATVNGKQWNDTNTGFELTSGPNLTLSSMRFMKDGEEIHLVLKEPTIEVHNFRLNEEFDMQPAVLIDFSVQRDLNIHKVKWQTATETNLSHFEVETSIEGTNWFVKALQPAKGSNSSYSFDFPYDFNTWSTQTDFYYRLKLVDKNGQFQYSPIILVRGGWLAYFKPVGEAPWAGHGSIEITSVDTTHGYKLMSGKFQFSGKSGTTSQPFSITDGEFSMLY